MTIQQAIPLPKETPAPEATPAADANARVTPMMEQYLEIKAGHPGLLLFYRMGDFYELFFEDAEIASRTLGIVLTKRGKHQGMDIPMCGVPVERSEDYLHRLLDDLRQRHAGVAFTLHTAIGESPPVLQAMADATVTVLGSGAAA